MMVLWFGPSTQWQWVLEIETDWLTERTVDANTVDYNDKDKLKNCDDEVINACMYVI
jgi:hypothetical protein